MRCRVKHGVNNSPSETFLNFTFTTTGVVATGINNLSMHTNVINDKKEVIDTEYIRNTGSFYI